MNFSQQHITPKIACGTACSDACLGAGLWVYVGGTPRVRVRSSIYCVSVGKSHRLHDDDQLQNRKKLNSAPNKFDLVHNKFELAPNNFDLAPNKFDLGPKKIRFGAQ